MTKRSTGLANFTTDLHEVVAASLHPDTLPKVAESLAHALRRRGIPVDRLQLPLSMVFGLKHPIHAGIILTWTDGSGSKAWLRPREQFSLPNTIEVLRKSPFAAVALDGVPAVRMRKSTPKWNAFPLLQQLEQDGFVDYVVTATDLPDGARQVVSLATRRATGFSEDIIEELETLCAPLSLALFGIYQAQTAQQIATTYLGQHTGTLVMEGQMGRGQSEALLAAIAFIDVRDFTRLSNELGVAGMLPLLNATFDAIDEAIRPLDGEILKFMGDAALVVFPRSAATVAPLIDVIDVLLTATEDVSRQTGQLGVSIQVGVGLHIGEVFYGNVGARGRHDFTVMGPAVNLASRLEGLAKVLHAPLIVSQAVANACSDTCGTPSEAATRLDALIELHSSIVVKGEPEPVNVWSIQRRARP